jgi:glycosyltransferase involved in cell wall biosynthesis
MKIVYVTHTRFPTEKAHGKQIAEVCSALTDIGHDVTLVCPRIRNTILESAHEYYDLPENFEVRYLHHFDANAHWWVPGILNFSITMFFYRRSLSQFLASYDHDLVYVRSVQLIPMLVQLRTPVFAELHTIPHRKQSLLVHALNRCATVVCLTTPMRDALVQLGVSAESMIVEGDGVLLSRFKDLESAADVREAFSVPTGRKLVGYVGSLVTRNTIEKGVAELISAIVLLRERDVPVTGLIVGGPPVWKLKYLKQARSFGLTEDDILFFDRVSAKRVPSILCACDVLVYPAPKTDHPYFMRDTSPLKLFEYLASGTPIVCADIPPIRDVVDDESVLLVELGSRRELAKGIELALESSTQQQAAKRKELAQWYSWQNRMQRILNST